MKFINLLYLCLVSFFATLHEAFETWMARATRKGSTRAGPVLLLAG